MSGILDRVDQRTKMAGENRLELLLFQLANEQIYGINVFKVKEIIPKCKQTVIPQSSPIVRGLTHIRGNTIPILDVNLAIGGKLTPDPENQLIIIAEYNQGVQGFMVNNVLRIIDANWGDIYPPPPGLGLNTYLTAVTRYENKLVEIIDVEKILQEVAPADIHMSEEAKSKAIEHKAAEKHIIICDDSNVARTQIKNALNQIGIKITTKNNGKEALIQLKEWAASGMDVPNEILMLISDVEMPEMDGYKLTMEIRNDPQLKDLHVILHTSLSGVFNNALVQKVGANKFIPKFEPNSLAEAVASRIEEFEKKNQ